MLEEYREEIRKCGGVGKFGDGEGGKA